MRSAWVLVLLTGGGVARAEGTVDQLEREARSAAADGLCETARFKASQLAPLDTERHRSLVAEPAVAACMQAAPGTTAEAAASAQPGPEVWTNCSTMYGEPSLLFGGATGSDDYLTTPGSNIERLAAGARFHRCTPTRSGIDLRLGLVLELSIKRQLYAGIGGELRVGWPVGSGLLGPRASVVVLDENFVGLWAGMRYDVGPISTGIDLFHVVEPKDWPADRQRPGVTGVYGVLGLTGKAGAITVVSGAALVGLVVLMLLETYDPVHEN